MKENYLEALKWYGKAADMGNAEAKYKLGKILFEEAKRYLQESWEQGNIDAIEYIKEKQIDIFYRDCIVFMSPKSFSISASKRWNGTIEYSLDKINWHNWDGKEIKSYIIYMRGCGNTVITGQQNISGTNASWIFKTKDKLICRGNIENLLNYKLCANGEHPPMSENCYTRMFQNCTSLSEAPSLPATELAKFCYSAMFSGCTSLSEAPALPAKKLADWCYSAMFKGCTSLKEAPALPAKKLAEWCYHAMFLGGISLKEVPALPATELAMWCYCSMFEGCTSLSEVPVLPATKLDVYGYKSMFKGCTSLKDRSNLPKSCFE